MSKARDIADITEDADINGGTIDGVTLGGTSAGAGTFTTLTTGSMTTTGGVYLGGTGSANYLDDYEEGSGTPAVEAVMGTRTVPDYQGIDQAKLVPLLVAAVQELAAEVATLKGATP